MELLEINALDTAAEWLFETTGRSFNAATLLEACAAARLTLCVAIPPEHTSLPEKIQRVLKANATSFAKDRVASTGVMPTLEESIQGAKARLTIDQRTDLLIRQLVAAMGLYSLHRWDAEFIRIHGHIYLHKGVPLDSEEQIQFAKAIRITPDMLRVAGDELRRFADTVPRTAWGDMEVKDEEGVTQPMASLHEGKPARQGEAVPGRSELQESGVGWHDWKDACRLIADIIDANDQRAGAYSGTVDMADRVANAIQGTGFQADNSAAERISGGRPIRGPRGPLTKGNVLREALQGGKWKRNR